MTRLAALGAGAVLFALPFLQSGLGRTHSHDSAPHMDHAPRHGGVLLMIGQYHLEIVEAGHAVELYVSDALRRPLRPRSGSVSFDGRPAQVLDWSGYRLTATTPPVYGAAEYSIAFEEGPPLSIKLSPTDLARLSRRSRAGRRGAR